MHGVPMFPHVLYVPEDGCAGINFTEVPGENIEFMGRSVADDVIVLSNYRLCLVRQSRIVINVCCLSSEPLQNSGL